MIAALLIAQALVRPISPLSPWRATDLPPEATQPGSGSRAPFINVRAAPYFADSTGATDSTAAFVAAIAALGSGGGDIVAPHGTYLVNLTITGNSVRIRGEGRRSTFLKPFVDAPVISIDSTAGSRQSNMVTDLGFDATGTGSTSPAILITGTNINDYITVQRFYMNGFTKSVNITGRCIWCTFEDGEITNDLSTEAAFDVNTSSAVNHMDLVNLRVASGAGDGLLFNATGGQVFKTIKFYHVDPESNPGAGIHLTNVDASEIDTCYIENNVTGVKIDGTFSRGVNVHGSLIWGTTQGTAYYNHATQATGTISGNFLDTTAAPTVNLDIATSAADSHLTIGSNYDTATSSGSTKLHTITTDANGKTHVSWVAPIGFEYNSESAAPATVSRRNMLRMTNAGAVTLNNLTGGDIGQIMMVWQAGGGTTTLTSGAGGTGQILLPNSKSVVLSGTDTAWLFYDGAAWRLIGMPTSPASQTWTPLTNATLGTPANGTMVYCSDCTIANPCAGAGTGALAKRLNGAWVCN